MKATLKVSVRADTVIQTLLPRDLRLVVKCLELLCDFPLMAQTADFVEAPDIRRAVAGQYLIYYRHDAQRTTIWVVAIRHGRQRPLTGDELAE